MITLLPMKEEEFTEFFELAVNAYASENVLGGRWRPEDAQALATAETNRLLGERLQTPDHYLFGVHSRHDKRSVGYLWFCEMQRGGDRIAFVFQVLVLPEYRRRGYARAALLALQKMAQSRGLSSLALHVFAHNEAAHALYRSLGYRISSYNLIRPLYAVSAPNSQDDPVGPRHGADEKL